jgi:transcription termination factor NusB
VAATTDDASRRDLKFAEADVKIREEFREYLEYELARTQAALDETDAAFRRLVESFDDKERYIDSLLSVRVKKWIVGRLRSRGS